MAAGKGEVRIGDRVNHSKLGVGEVLDVHPLGEETCAVISFEQWGQKKIILRYATLEILPELEEELEDDLDGAQDKKTASKSRKPAKAEKTTKATKARKAAQPKKAARTRKGKK